MNLRNLEVVLLELLDKFGSVQLAVASSSLDDLRLLLQCEVLPGKVWANIFFEEAENLVVGDGAWVGEVIDSGILVFRHEDGGREKIVKDGVGVGNVNHTLVLGDLGDKVAAVQVVADWHSKPEDERIGVEFHDLRQG